ncbi:hypothetical protein FDECE_3235 [Fusarium decemcellulare]|nr:hypothetical protein FDECE_3235 [Fusarium decemcellulare]
MDPLSITASVFAIIQTSDRVAGVCKYYIDTVKNYPKELRVIFIETKSLAAVCEGLRFLRQDDANDAVIIAGLEGSDGPIEECKTTVEQLESLLPSPDLPADSIPETRMRRFQSALEALAWIRKSEKAKILLGNLARFKSTIGLAIEGSLLQDVRNIKHALSQSQIREVCKWLQHTDPSPRHNDARELHQEGTGNWVLRCEKWKDWLNFQTRCLWIHGITGTGKTVLAAYLIDQISQICERKGDQRVHYVYYYCSYKRNQDETRPFLRWLVSQLCRQENIVPEHVYKLFQNGTVPDVQQLLEILHDLLAHLDHLFIVIDAVEQSDRLRSLLDRDDVGIPRRSLLKVVRNLTTDTRFEKIQLLITSCPDEYIKATMSDVSESISMSNLDVEEDVKLYVKARLQSEPKFVDWPQKMRDDAEHCLCQSVKRGFRWVDDTLHRLLEVPLDRSEDEMGYLHEELVEWSLASSVAS